MTKTTMRLFDEVLNHEKRMMVKSCSYLYNKSAPAYDVYSSEEFKQKYRNKRKI